MRQFLGWNRPALPAAAEYLLTRYRQGEVADLSRVIVVVPVARAGRRLLELLVLQAEAESLLLTPPEILTEGALPERLYLPKRPFANELAQHLAWSQALRGIAAEKLRHLVPHPPAATDTLGWLELGEMLARVHRELAADGLSFGDVARRGKEIPGFVEQDRWGVLCDVQEAYLRQLDELDLWDVQTARLVALQQREFQTNRDIVLLGMVDPNVTLRRIMQQLADHVTALVHAPAELAERFDEQGCLITDQWLACELPVDDAQIDRVDGPADQADAAVRWLDVLGGKYRTDEVVVGVTDPLLVPQLQRELAQVGIDSRWIEGQRLAESCPFRFIEILAAFVERRRFADLAALVRHPDVYDWLLQQPGVPKSGLDLLTTLDDYYGEAYPAQLDAQRLQREAAEDGDDGEIVSERQRQRRQRAATLLWLLNCLESLAEPLLAKPQDLSAWAAAIRTVLARVYAARRLQRRVTADYYLLAALRELGNSLATQAALPEALAPRVRLSEAIEMLLRPLARGSIPPPAQEAAIELLSWLELALDDAPALVVTTFNEGLVPTSVLADAFLPNNLRRQLGLLHNDRRYARDAYVVSALIASRERLQFIVGHRDPEGNPLTPSRLLFATDAEKAAARALKFFSALPPSSARRNLLAGAGPPRERSEIVIPLPDGSEKIPAHLSVSQFKAYLACPYRFYLSHILKLTALADAAAELDGAAFGDLIHDCLQHFGRDADVRAKTDPDVIFAFLSERLDRLAGARFTARGSRPAIRVQVEQVRTRFRAFSRWQAERTLQGWQIAYSEDFDKQLSTHLQVDGEPFELRGRIDRIDYHPDTKQLCVLDYKTGDTGYLPEKTHRRKQQWLDLQLPLYRHLLRTVDLGLPSECSARPLLGYINLPKNLDALGVELAEWTPDDLAAADEAACAVIRGIRQRVFWPKNDAPEYEDDFVGICQDGVLEPWRCPDEVAR